MLPDEMLLKMLNFLNIKELVKCRLVSKRFRFWVDQVQPIELAVSNCSLKAKKNWLFAKHVLDKQVLEIGRLSAVFQTMTFKLHQLKRLRLDGDFLCDMTDSDTEFNLNLKLLQLPTFSMLIHLELGYLNLGESKSLSLFLPHLKLFAVTNICSIQSAFKLNLNMPALEALAYGCWSKHIQLAHPHTVRFLKISRREHNFKLYENVEVFKSRYLASVEADILRSAKNLKELHLKPTNLLDSFSHITETMNQLLTERKALGRNDLKIFFSNQLLDGEKSFEEYQFDRTHSLFSNKAFP